MADLDFLGDLDPDDPRPSSQQIANKIRAAILTQKLAPGDKLPSQPELADRYGVARETVKRALDLLRAERLIVSRQGSGSYVRARTQRPVELRPYVEMAFQQDEVSIDFAGFSGETLRDVLAEPLDQVRAGKLRPRRLRIRVLLPDTSAALPRTIDSDDDQPQVRARSERITRRAAEGILDQATELGDLGLIAEVEASVRRYSGTPQFKLYILNEHDVFFGFYDVVRRSVAIAGEQISIFDLMGKDATLFHYAADDDETSHGAQFVEAARTWFESVWDTIAQDYEP